MRCVVLVFGLLPRREHAGESTDIVLHRHKAKDPRRLAANPGAHAGSVDLVESEFVPSLLKRVILPNTRGGAGCEFSVLAHTWLGAPTTSGPFGDADLRRLDGQP
eukprot:gene1688-477_t